MLAATHRRFVRPRRVAVAASLAVVCGLVLSSCFSANQTKLMDLTNATRRANGKGAVAGDSKAMAKAQAWAEHMARVGAISHTGGGHAIDTSGLPKWCQVGENVGYGTSIQNIYDKWMASSVHRPNILGPFNKIGTGVARNGSTVYAIQIFFRSC